MPNITARQCAGRLAGTTATALSLLAAWAGTGQAAEEAHKGLPQLDPTAFPPQLIWLAICFSVLYLLMSRVALPKVGQVLEQRQEHITADLDRAQALRDEAATVMAAYEKALAEARSEAQTLMAKTSAETAEIQAARTRDFAGELAERTQAAEARIRAAKDQALSNVHSVAAEIARDVADKVAGVEIDAADADTAVAAALERRA